MKKIYLLIFLAVLIVGCQSASKKNESDKKILTVTIEPQRYFLDNIVGEAFKVNTLVPPGTSPETYEPAPSVIMELSKSAIYFKVGDLGFENVWTARLAENNPDVLIADCSKGIDLLNGHAHEHEHGEQCSHSEMDPHTWSSPAAVKIIARNMLDAVVEIDSENAETYRANFNAFISKVEETDSIIRAKLSNTPSKGFIIYHPALGYFAQDYGLHQHSIEFEGKNPSPAQIKELVDIAKAERINTVFVQKGFDMKNAEVVAKEIGADVFEINPLAYEWDVELLRIAEILSRDADE